MSNKDSIIIRGLRQNNLKNVSLDIPKEKITVFTGISSMSVLMAEVQEEKLFLQEHLLKW